MSLKLGSFKSFLDAVMYFTGKELEEAIQLLKTEGKDIESIEDIFVNKDGELFELLLDGTIIKVNLYIATKEINNYFNLNDFSINDLYKYHIYQCTTISNMFNSGRKHRYKINNRDNGTFYYTFSNKQGNILKTDENQKLNICKNCLKKFINKSNISDEDVRNFELNKFHKNNKFFPFHADDYEQGEYAKPNVYPPEWNKISKKLKEMHDYTCENCGYHASSDYKKKFIHTHHKNGDKQNNGYDNLKVLCVKCHAEVDGYHSRIKSSEVYKEFSEQENIFA